jgi:hypothetical protein
LTIADRYLAWVCLCPSNAGERRRCPAVPPISRARRRANRKKLCLLRVFPLRSESVMTRENDGGSR